MERSNGSESGKGGSYWEGYSHYKTVSQSITDTIDEALEAYARLDSLHKEDVKLTRGDSRKEVADARAKIKLAALKLVPELREDATTKEQYQHILARWNGSYELDREEGSIKKVQPQFPNDPPEGGYFSALDKIMLHDQCPNWLGDWVIDIRTAGWELGYLKSGRKAQDKSGLDPADEQATAMFES